MIEATKKLPWLAIVVGALSTVRSRQYPNLTAMAGERA